jgi:hypothetical protein
MARARKYENGFIVETILSASGFSEASICDFPGKSSFGYNDLNVKDLI